MVESEEDYYAAEEADTYIKGSSKDDKKRRFSEQQVKSMELMFQTQTKLEPRKKLQLAKELGLHPRQVAIWFQNKRARWKSKKLEREYNALRAEYDALLYNFESVKNEKLLLAKQLKKLGELTDKPMEEKGENGKCRKEDEMPNFVEKEKIENIMRVNLDDVENRCDKFMDFFSELPMESEQRFFSHQLNWPLDHSDANSQWWEVWPMNE